MFLFFFLYLSYVLGDVNKNAISARRIASAATVMPGERFVYLPYPRYIFVREIWVHASMEVGTKHLEGRNWQSFFSVFLPRTFPTFNLTPFSNVRVNVVELSRRRLVRAPSRPLFPLHPNCLSITSFYFFLLFLFFLFFFAPVAADCRSIL